LHCTEGGRYFHLTGNTDKGKAIAVLKSLYCQMFGRVETFGVGNGPNDFPMLKIVDKPFFIKKKAGVNSSFIAWTGILQLIRKAVI
jgi:predicted mannosyl-3-phosphoglycerate phosphatase (HAD superfamily)